MTVNNLRRTVVTASKVPLLGHATVHGQNTYTIGTNLLAWDNTNNYLLSTVAVDFGQATKVDGELAFKCGENGVSVFDFGLLFSCFVGITTAYVESGSGLSVDTSPTTTPDIYATWFGSYVVLYSVRRNIVIPIKSSDIHHACKYDDVRVENFNDTRTFKLEREGVYLVLMTEQGELLCKFRVPDHARQVYPQLFMTVEPTSGSTADGEIATPWDKDSQLGSLVAGSISMTDAESTVRKYKAKTILDNVVVRDDLIFTPSVRYGKIDELFGSICYTDKGNISLAVNFRNSLFVYEDWFGGENEKGISIDTSPKFSGFYNVTEECTKIEYYANSVTVRPLTAAEFDIDVFERVKQAFYSLELPRLQFASTFGKVVIPEPILLNGLTSGAGESIYCIVPVGAVGDNVVCVGSTGKLQVIQLHKSETGTWEPWGFDTAFYDITGVIT